MDNQAYFTYDGLGSVTNVNDDTGAATDSYSYDVFGATRSHIGGSDSPWLFTGQQADASSGLYYVRARHYDPSTGRFMSKDPRSGYKEHPISQNPYIYALNDPCDNTDRTGLAAESIGTHTHCHAEINLKGFGGFTIPCGFGGKCELLPGLDDLAQLSVDVTFSGNSRGSISISTFSGNNYGWFEIGTPQTYEIGSGFAIVARFETDRGIFLAGSATLGVGFGLDGNGNWFATTDLNTSHFGGADILLTDRREAYCEPLPPGGGGGIGSW